MVSRRFHQAIWREASLDSEDKRTAKLWSWHVHVIIATTRCALHAAVFLRESSTLTSVRIMFYPKVNHSQRSSYSCCVQNWNISLFGPKRVFLLREFFQRRCFGKRRISKQKSFLCEEFRRSLMAGGFQDPSPFNRGISCSERWRMLSNFVTVGVVNMAKCLWWWKLQRMSKIKSNPKSKTWYCPECQKRRRGKSMRTQRKE